MSGVRLNQGTPDETTEGDIKCEALEDDEDSPLELTKGGKYFCTIDLELPWPTFELLDRLSSRPAPRNKHSFPTMTVDTDTGY